MTTRGRSPGEQWSVRSSAIVMPACRKRGQGHATFSRLVKHEVGPICCACCGLDSWRSLLAPAIQPDASLCGMTTEWVSQRRNLTSDYEYSRCLWTTSGLGTRDSRLRRRVQLGSLESRHPQYLVRPMMPRRGHGATGVAVAVRLVHALR